MRKIIVSLAALLGGIYISSASVTPQGWWHYGEVSDYYQDSSGNTRRFNEGFSRVGGGNAGAHITAFGCGGPLGTTGWTSTDCLYWNSINGDAAGMWAPGNAAIDPGTNSDGVATWNPPSTNYVIELWCLPVWPGTWSGGGNAQPWLFCSGSSGGVYFQLTNDTVSTIAIMARITGNNTIIGDPVVVTTNNWTHLAIVNVNGTQTFYVNGVQHGAPDVGHATVPAGDIFAGSAPGTTPTYAGYLDELRISTFAPGAFALTDLLTRPSGPSIITQPQSATVWDGGAAPFTVVAAIDSSVTYQWQRNSNNITGATSATYTAPQVSMADSGAQFRCILTASSISLTSAVATLTVVPVKTADAAFYRQAVNSESSLAAYFPVDGDTGTTLRNTKDPSHNGTLENGAGYDGRTNRAFGERALAFTGAGDVQVPNNPAFEFSDGNGTIEALTYLASGSSQPGTIFSLAFEGSDTSSAGYALQASADGSQLLYANGAPTSLSWSVPANLIGRLAYVALVIDHLTNVTAIVDGQSLGTKTQTGFGNTSAAPAYIGSIGSSVQVNPFNGDIDEVAVYGSALPLNTLQVHYSRFLYGTNVSAPSIVSLPGPRTVLAGTAPILKPQVAGTLPISYQWTANNVPIPGATASTLKAISGPGTVDYVLYATNAIGWTNSQLIAITFIAPPSPYSAVVAADHPIAYWRLDETAGPTAIDSAGYHDGTYVGSPVFGAPSVITTETDKGVDFAGTSSVSVPNYPELNPLGAFSLEAWTRPNSGGSDQGGFIVASQNRSNSRGGYSLNADFFFAEYDIDLGAPNSSVTRYDSTTVPQDGVPAHIVFAWDGVSPQGAIYINGVKTTTPQAGYTGDMNNFVNNTVQPLTMGIRYDGSGPWNGVVDEVAFYDYALSDAQVTNHFRFSWVASAITQQPVGVTSTEGSTVSLSFTASGYPNTYQWYQGSTPLDPATPNPDGTLKYPSGVNGTTLVIAQTVPADSGSYHAVVINSLGGSITANAQVLITADTTPPVVTLVQALGTPNTSPDAARPYPYLVKVLFNKRIGQFTGTFTIAGTAAGSPTFFQDVTAATLGADWRSVIVPTSGLTPGQSYTINITGVKDQTVAGNQIVTTNVTFRAPTLTQGLVVWDYYYLGSTTGSGIVTDLTSNQNYPNAPMTNWYSSTFDSDPITGGDLNNVPAFGSLGDRYGCSLSGWITPAVTTNYYFFIASDDASELDLSTDDSPTNAVSIAVCSSFTGAFAEPGAENTSALQSLVAGRKYFIRALQVEGNGGDFVKVAWRMDGDTNAAPTLSPIPSTYLSSYAPVPIAFNPLVYSGGVLTISWSGTATLLQSTNAALPLSQWTTAATTSPYQVTPAASGARMFYRLRQ
jgi:hypothetical protein